MISTDKRHGSIQAFASWVMGIIVIVFMLVMLFSYDQIHDAEMAFQNERRNTAIDQLKLELNALQLRLEEIAESYADSDETRQQFNNTQYYVYWRDSRVSNYRAYNAYLTKIELYRDDGSALASQLSAGFPELFENSRKFLVHDEQGTLFLYHLSPVYAPIKETGTLGFMVIKYHLGELIRSEMLITDIDMTTLGFNLRSEDINKLSELARFSRFSLSASSNIESLIAALSKNLIILGIFVPVFSIMALLVFTSAMVRPIRYFVTLVHELGNQKIARPTHISFKFSELQNIWRAILEYREQVSSMHVHLDKKNKELWEMAHLDPLTGCHNRRAFEEDWYSTLETIEQHRITLSFILFDCDRFKLINDHYGHYIGDKVLVHIANTIQENLREGDKLYRLGGDEFCTILINTDEAESRAVARRCLKHLTRSQHEGLNVNEPLRMSAGIAIASGMDAGDLYDLQRQADMAMYYAKRPSNDSIAVYKDFMLQDSLYLFNNEVITLVYDAIYGMQGMQIHYQPIMNLQEREVEYYEALCRLENGDELLSPGIFLPIVEDRHIETEFDQLVIRQVHDDLANNVLPTGSGISINISGVGIINKQVITELGTLAEFFDKYTIYVEVTETSLITHMGNATKHLEQLRTQGFKVSLDDFGSGYSSLGYLTQMPVDSIKFDLTLIHALTKDNRQSVIVRSLADMCLKAGYQIVAEGIEDEVLLRLVMSLGFTYAQGYYIGRPKKHPLEEKELEQYAQLFA